jgi:hypothetical protein
MPAHRFDGFTPIDSDHMDGAKYNAVDRKLTIRYKNGYVYEVHGVSSEDHQAFMDASSQGEHYHQVIKNNFHIERVK